MISRTYLAFSIAEIALSSNHVYIDLQINDFNFYILSYVSLGSFIEPNSGILSENHLTMKPARKMIYLKTFLLLDPPCKFADFPKILLDDYLQIVLYGESYLAFRLDLTT
jgi:hypothetical protein